MSISESFFLVIYRHFWESQKQGVIYSILWCYCKKKKNKETNLIALVRSQWKQEKQGTQLFNVTFCISLNINEVGNYPETCSDQYWIIYYDLLDSIISLIGHFMESNSILYFWNPLNMQATKSRIWKRFILVKSTWSNFLLKWMYFA